MSWRRHDGGPDAWPEHWTDRDRQWARAGAWALLVFIGCVLCLPLAAVLWAVWEADVADAVGWSLVGAALSGTMVVLSFMFTPNLEE